MKLNLQKIKQGNLNVEVLGRGFVWLDTGTHESLLEASRFVQTIELRQGYKIACLEEIAFSKGWLLLEEVTKAAEAMGKNSYGKYLGEIVAENGFVWDDEGWMVGGAPVRVRSHQKGLMVQKMAKINGFETDKIVCVGDSGTDLSMCIGASRFIGFNPIRESSRTAFRAAEVDIVEGRDLRCIWPQLFPDEDSFPR